MRVPSAFCWTKFGTESGESIDEILARKELERTLNDGLFLWGIGNSVAPSLPILLGVEPDPSVLFSPMRSRPARHDVSPTKVVRWNAGVGLDGQEFAIPEATVVTSRHKCGRRGDHHFALVCHSDTPLAWDGGDLATLSEASLRNLASGARLGSSQVTSVVSYELSPAPAPKYGVAFAARLTPPYLVKLQRPSLVASEVSCCDVFDASRTTQLDLGGAFGRH